MEHVRALVGATDLPISVDLENGYGAEPWQAAVAVTQAAEAGAVGGSIEDYDPRVTSTSSLSPSSASRPLSKRRAGSGGRSR